MSSLNKSDKKIVLKARNWTDDETVILCEILADTMNRFLHTLETKALKKHLQRYPYAFKRRNEKGRICSS